MSDVLVIAPHADDEVLGCGGALLRHRAHGEQLHWLIVTDRKTTEGYSEAQVLRREEEIRRVRSAFGFSSVVRLGLTPAHLDALPLLDIVSGIGRAVKELAPSIVYLPFRGDIHSDHRVVFDAGVACTKWFRYPSVRRVLCYETISETDMGANPESLKFTPNYFVDIGVHLERKLEICSIYDSEMASFPFPRSPDAIRALAQVRGAACGAMAAEAFMLIRENVR